VPTSDPPLDRLILRFRDRVLERAFQEDARPVAARQFRHAILAVAIIRALFTLAAVVDDHASGPAVPDLIILVLFWAAYAFAHTRVYERLVRPTVVSLCLLYVALATARFLGSAPSSDDRDIGALSASVASLWGLSNLHMLMLFAFIFTRGSFLTANLIAWTGIVAWNAALVAQTGRPLAPVEGYLVYCLIAYAGALLAGRAIESGLRRDFLIRRRDQEYIRNVAIVTNAARDVEAGAFEPPSLDPVAHRVDALGQLARTFQRMASEVRAREQRLQQEVEELRVEIDHAKRAREVAQVTNSDYFKRLRQRAAEMRRGQGPAGDRAGP
jgi:hypothetical protein